MLDAIMDHVGWKSSKSARHGLGGAADILEEDLAKAYKQCNNLHGFTIAF